MISPTCTVNGGSTLTGVNVTAGSTITIALQNTSGVVAWSISATSTNDLTNQPLGPINATLSVNQITKTATVTMPNTASTVIFTSVVNNGVDLNRDKQASYTTTFEVCVLTAAGARLFAVGETSENDNVNGWVSKLNYYASNFVTNPASAGAGLTFVSGAYNVGQNIDATIKVNADDIQLNPAFYSTSGVATTLAERDASGNLVTGTSTNTCTLGGTNITFATGVATPVITQANNTTNFASAQALTIQAQSATGTASNGGALNLKGGTGVGSSGLVNTYAGATLTSSFGASSINFNVAAFTFSSGLSTPSISQIVNTNASATGQALTVQAQNCSGTTSIGGALTLKSGTGTSTPGSVTINAGSTLVSTYASTGVTYSLSTLQWANTVTSPTLTQAAQTSDVATQTLNITAQSPFASATGSNRNPGIISLNLPSPAGAGTVRGSVVVVDNGNTVVSMQGDATGNGTVNISGTGTISGGSSLNVKSSSVTISSGSTLVSTYGTTSIVYSIPTLQFASTVSSPTINQATTSTASATGQTLLIQGQVASGTSSTGGDIELLPGTGTLHNGNVAFFGAASAGSGHNVIFIQNRSEAPSTNPVNGGVLYAEGGALKWKGSGGTVTQLAGA